MGAFRFWSHKKYIKIIWLFAQFGGCTVHHLSKTAQKFAGHIWGIFSWGMENQLGNAWVAMVRQRTDAVPNHA
jgi:hypothetical protein